jgi:2-polyprenyl-6-methoxyphenol hydroxylase-like FAD-dependent oxidoreductase
VESDLLIVGAGPAGCAAAITALETGCSVTLLERKAQLWQQPGETLHPGVEPLLRQLGIWEDVEQQGFHRHEGIWREAKDGKRAFAPYGHDPSGPWLGIQVDRVILNRLLRSRVRDLGGVIFESTCLGFAREADRFAILSDELRLRATMALDASGRQAWLARQLELTPEFHVPGQRLWFGWKRNAPPDLENQPLFVEHSDGWDWLCPLSAQRCSWVTLVRGKGKGGMDYTPRVYRQCAGEDYMLLGDAAFLLDPSLANGVLRALMSGIYAGTLYSHVRAGRIPSEVAAQEYRAWISRFFDKSLVSMKTSPAPRVAAPGLNS